MKILKKICNRINEQRLKSAIKHNRQDKIQRALRYKKMTIGDNVVLCTFNFGPEPYLIEIGDNTIISSNVSFITHDAAFCAINSSRGVGLFGKIIIGKNCFIGMNSTIIYGVRIADGCIIAANSVVTKSYKEKNVVLAGNPAKIIGTVDEYISKHNEAFIDISRFSYEEKQAFLLENNKLILK